MLVPPNQISFLVILGGQYLISLCINLLSSSYNVTLKGPVTRGNLLPWHVPATSRLVWHVCFYAIRCHNLSQPLIAWIQMSLNSCDTSQRQNIARTFRPLVWHALATCHCDKSVNKPITGLPCDHRPWEKGLGTCRSDKSPRVTCMWFSHWDMLLRQVTSCDRTLKVQIYKLIVLSCHTCELE